jgi:hypothetical protein
LTNTQAYYDMEIFKGIKGFVVQGHGVNTMKHFSSSLAIKSQMRLTFLPGLTRKYGTRLERLSRDKCSSLFNLFGSGEEKSFIALNTGACIIKLITAVIYVFQ